ncbi:MAG: hypothetical protein HZB61_10215 [Nitrospirae bacterium]|nr:hypothetical protein [Nitrospirota bacterium]
MHTVELIAAALEVPFKRPELPCDTIKGICCVTGEKGDCLPRKELLGKSFTNGDLLAAPESPHIGIDAYLALTYKWERMSSWYCDGEKFERLDRQGVRTMVLNAEYGAQWAGYATTSYKKHGSLFAKVNSGDRIVWRFEMRDVDCSDHARLMAIWDRLNVELRGGIGRGVLESLLCPPFLLRQIGAGRWIDFERFARPLFQGALYRFLCYLLPSQEELKNEYPE